MIINATLLMQAFHFWLAYMILTRLLFKPVFMLISTQEHQEESVRGQIDRVTESITLKTAQNAHEWAMMQKELLNKKPALATREVVFEPPEPEEPVFDEDEVVQLIKQTKLELIKRVGHDQCH